MRPSATAALVFAVISAGISLLEAWDPSKPGAWPRVFVAQIATADKVQQALNRPSYGPRPGDVEWVRAMGLDKWIGVPEALEEVKK